MSNSQEKQKCPKCGSSDHLIGVTNLAVPSEVKGNTTIYRPTSICMDCFMELRFGKKRSSK